MWKYRGKETQAIPRGSTRQNSPALVSSETGALALGRHVTCSLLCTTSYACTCAKQQTSSHARCHYISLTIACRFQQCMKIQALSRLYSDTLSQHMHTHSQRRELVLVLIPTLSSKETPVLQPQSQDTTTVGRISEAKTNFKKTTRGFVKIVEKKKQIQIRTPAPTTTIITPDNSSFS